MLNLVSKIPFHGTQGVLRGHLFLLPEMSLLWMWEYADVWERQCLLGKYRWTWPSALKAQRQDWVSASRWSDPGNLTQLAKIHKRLTSVIQWKTTATWQEKQGGWAHSLPVVNNMETYLKTMRRLCLRVWKYLKVLFLLQAELWVNRDVPLWTLTRNKGNEPDSSTVSRLLPKRLFPLTSAR